MHVRVAAADQNVPELLTGEASSEFREGPKECGHRLTPQVTDLVPFGPVFVGAHLRCLIHDHQIDNLL